MIFLTNYCTRRIRTIRCGRHLIIYIERQLVFKRDGNNIEKTTEKIAEKGTYLEGWKNRENYNELYFCVGLKDYWDTINLLWYMEKKMMFSKNYRLMVLFQIKQHVYFRWYSHLQKNQNHLQSIGYMGNFSTRKLLTYTTANIWYLQLYTFQCLFNSKTPFEYLYVK